jgi:hypothetical protein
VTTWRSGHHTDAWCGDRTIAGSGGSLPTRGHARLQRKARRPAFVIRACILVLTITTILASSRSSEAKPGAAAPALKAAFVYNFARFTDWPDEVLAAGSPLTMCIVGDVEMSGALRALTSGQTAGNHQLIVRELDHDGDNRWCHILYSSGLNSRAVAQLLSDVRDEPVLTISDTEGFAKLGGVAELYSEQGKMRFAINLESAQRSRVRLSSRLLSLARIVRGN